MTSSDEETPECRVCLEDLRLASGDIRQCPVGHLQCSACFVRVGGDEAPCPVCKRTMGNIRAGYLEGMRDRYQARQSSQAAGRASPPISVQEQVLRLAQTQMAAACGTRRTASAVAAKQRAREKESRLERDAEGIKREAEAAKKKQEAAEAVTWQGEEVAARKMQEVEAAKRRQEDAEAAAWRREEEDATIKQEEAEAAARRREEEDRKKKHEAAMRQREEMASRKKQEATEATARRRAVAKRREEEAEAAASKRRQQAAAAQRREEEAAEKMRAAEDREMAARRWRKRARMCKMMCPWIIFIIVLLPVLFLAPHLAIILLLPTLFLVPPHLAKRHNRLAADAFSLAIIVLLATLFLAPHLFQWTQEAPERASAPSLAKKASTSAMLDSALSDTNLMQSGCDSALGDLPRVSKLQQLAKMLDAHPIVQTAAATGLDSFDLHATVYWLDRLQELLDEGQFDRIVKMDKTILVMVDDLKHGSWALTREGRDGQVNLASTIGSHLLYQLSLAYRALGQHKKAIKFSEQAMDLSNSAPHSLFELCDFSFRCAQPLALAYYSAGQYLQAADVISACLNLAVDERNFMQGMTAMRMMLQVDRVVDEGSFGLSSAVGQLLMQAVEMQCAARGKMTYIPSRHVYQCGSRSDFIVPGALDGGKSFRWFSELEPTPLTVRCHFERAREPESQREHMGERG